MFSTAHRHVSFLSESEFISHRWLMRQPLLAMYGPRWNHNGKRTTQMSPPGHILIPPFNPLPEFQLSVVSSNQKQTQPVPLQEDRKYSFVSAAPSLNKKMGSGGSKSSRIFRKLLYNIPLQQQQQQQTIGGLPYIASEI